MPAKAGKKDAPKQGGGGGSELEKLKRLVLEKVKEVGSPHVAQALLEARQDTARGVDMYIPTANPSPYLTR